MHRHYYFSTDSAYIALIRLSEYTVFLEDGEHNSHGQQTTITDGGGTRNFSYDPATQALYPSLQQYSQRYLKPRTYDAYLPIV